VPMPPGLSGGARFGGLPMQGSAVSAVGLRLVVGMYCCGGDVPAEAVLAVLGGERCSPVEAQHGLPAGTLAPAVDAFLERLNRLCGELGIGANELRGVLAGSPALAG